MFSFYLPHELKKIGLGGFGHDVIIKKTVQLYNPSKIFFGNNVIVDDFCLITAEKDVVIKNNVHINAYSSIFGKYGIEMEDFSGLSCRVSLYSESDDYTGNSLTNPTIPMKFKPKYNTGKIHLNKHVIIGSGSTVLPGITVGEGSAVGAHSLVTKDLSSWSMYFGAPVKKIRNRSKKILELEQDFSNQSPTEKANLT